MNLKSDSTLLQFKNKGSGYVTADVLDDVGPQFGRKKFGLFRHS